jgi:hypothetical protein
MRLFTHRRTPEDDSAVSDGPGRSAGAPEPGRRHIAHVRQDILQGNGELVEDVVTSAVVESTAIAEAGGVLDADAVPEVDGAPEEGGDRILWIAPLPKDDEAPVEPTGQVGRVDPDRDPDER